MTYAHERDEFIAACIMASIPLHSARLLLRHATTLQRLAVAQCNGDYPCDNGERSVIPCPLCRGGYVPTAITGSISLPQDTKGCPDCRTSAAVRLILQGTWYRAVFNGDPRGAVLQLYPVGTSHADIDSGRVRGLYVPPSQRY